MRESTRYQGGGSPPSKYFTGLYEACIRLARGAWGHHTFMLSVEQRRAILAEQMLKLLATETVNLDDETVRKLLEYFWDRLSKDEEVKL